MNISGNREWNIALAIVFTVIVVFLTGAVIGGKINHDRAKNDEIYREAMLVDALHDLEDLRDELVEIDIDGVYVRKVDSIGVKINSLTCCY